MHHSLHSSSRHRGHHRVLRSVSTTSNAASVPTYKEFEGQGMRRHQYVAALKAGWQVQMPSTARATFAALRDVGCTKLGSGGQGVVFSMPAPLGDRAVKLSKVPFLDPLPHLQQAAWEATLRSHLAHDVMVDQINTAIKTSLVWASFEDLLGAQAAGDNQRCLIIVQELPLIDGGMDLGKYCRKMDEAKLPMRDRQAAVALVFPQLKDLVFHMHNNGIILHDIKPDNVMLQVLADQSLLVHLLDMGFASMYGRERLLPGHTLAYCPLEALVTPHCQGHWKLDLYALGVILFCMVCGLSAHPYLSPEQIDFVKRIPDNRWEFLKTLLIRGMQRAGAAVNWPAGVREQLHPALVALVEGLLQVDAGNRASWDQVHAWCAEFSQHVASMQGQLPASAAAAAAAAAAASPSPSSSLSTAPMVWGSTALGSEPQASPLPSSSPSSTSMAWGSTALGSGPQSPQGPQAALVLDPSQSPVSTAAAGSERSWSSISLSSGPGPTCPRAPGDPRTTPLVGVSLSSGPGPTCPEAPGDPCTTPLVGVSLSSGPGPTCTGAPGDPCTTPLVGVSACSASHVIHTSLSSSWSSVSLGCGPEPTWPPCATTPAVVGFSASGIIICSPQPKDQASWSSSLSLASISSSCGYACLLSTAAPLPDTECGGSAATSSGGWRETESDALDPLALPAADDPDPWHRGSTSGGSADACSLSPLIPPAAPGISSRSLDCTLGGGECSAKQQEAAASTPPRVTHSQGSGAQAGTTAPGLVDPTAVMDRLWFGGLPSGGASHPSALGGQRAVAGVTGGGGWGLGLVRYVMRTIQQCQVRVV